MLEVPSIRGLLAAPGCRPHGIVVRGSVGQRCCSKIHLIGAQAVSDRGGQVEFAGGIYLELTIGLKQKRGQS